MADADRQGLLPRVRAAARNRDLHSRCAFSKGVQTPENPQKMIKPRMAYSRFYSRFGTLAKSAFLQTVSN